MALSMSDDSDDNVSAIVVEAIEPGIHITQNMILVALGCLIMLFGVAVGFVFGWLVGSTSSEYEGLDDYDSGYYDNRKLFNNASASDLSSATTGASNISSAIPTTIPDKDKVSSEEIQYTVYGLTLRQNNDITLQRGKSVTLSVEINPDNVPQSYVKWSSDNEKVATVNENGQVVAKKRGQATITATAGDRTVTCLIRVP